VRNFTVSGASSLERRVRKELEGQGILDSSEQKEPADDEILTELKRCQAELKVFVFFKSNSLSLPKDCQCCF
jgi:hypothetical protein